MMAGTLHPILSVYPSRALVSEKFRVLVENLPPALSVTLHSLHCSETSDYWEAFGHYVADHTGTVDGRYRSDGRFTSSITSIHTQGLLAHSCSVN